MTAGAGPRYVLAFAAVVEIGTAAALLVDPALVVAWLLGSESDATVRIVARCFGVAILALGFACWPGRAAAPDGGAAAVRAMLAYNALVAAYLGYLGASRQAAGPLLWPAVAVHAAVALALAVGWSRRHGAHADDSR